MKNNLFKRLMFIAAVLFVLVALSVRYFEDELSQDGDNSVDRFRKLIITETPLLSPRPNYDNSASGHSDSYPVAGQQDPQWAPSGTCRDGDVMRQNVKNCSAKLECYSLTPTDERYCRLPDGRCSFFCTDK